MTKNNKSWKSICHTNELVVNSGVCALINEGTADEQQVALFYLKSNTDTVYAICNKDPFSKVNIIYRGLLGSTKDDIFVASPLYKQRFSLVDGHCLDDDSININIYQSRVNGEYVELLV